MADYRLPSIAELPNLPAEDRTEALGHLFERCPTLVQLVLDTRLNPDHSFQSYTDLIEQIRGDLLGLLDDESDPRISKIIAAHPRLGAKKVESAHSQAEQKSLQAASEIEAAKLLDLNNKYEETFPGLRYVVFVNGRSRDVIMENMKQRIARGDISAERREALNAMCDIAKDRASKLNVS